MADSGSSSPDKKRQQPPPIEFVKPGEEQAPQPSQERPPAAWVTRPEDYQRPQYAQPQPQRPRAAPQGPGNTARIAAVILILTAVVSGGYMLLNSLTPMSPADYANITNDTTAYVTSQVCAFFVLWGQAIMALAGIMAFQRLNWRMTVGCAFISMILVAGFGLAVLVDPVLLVTAFMGILGFVLIVIAKKEFVS